MGTLHRRGLILLAALALVSAGAVALAGTAGANHEGGYTLDSHPIPRGPCPGLSQQHGCEVPDEAAPPPDLHTCRSTEAGILLDWTEPSGAVAEIVYRATGEGPLEPYDAAGQPPWVDHQVEPGVTYRYELHPLNVPMSDPSNVCTVTHQPAPEQPQAAEPPKPAPPPAPPEPPTAPAPLVLAGAALDAANNTAFVVADVRLDALGAAEGTASLGAANVSGPRLAGATVLGETEAGDTRVWLRFEDVRAADAFAATFSNVSGGEWWVEADVAASAPLAGVDARVDGGGWQPLAAQDWGAWAASVHAPPGSEVQLRARGAGGGVAVSEPVPWPPEGAVDLAAPAPLALDRAEYAPGRGVLGLDLNVRLGAALAEAGDANVAAPGATDAAVENAWGGAPDARLTLANVSQDALFVADFHHAAGGPWWVEVQVDANRPVFGVDVRVDNGSWQPLDDQGWGWAKSVHAPPGSAVQFRARSDTGALAASAPVAWPPSG